MEAGKIFEIGHFKNVQNEYWHYKVGKITQKNWPHHYGVVFLICV